MRPDVTFTVRPNPESRLFITVVIFPNPTQLRRHLLASNRHPGRGCLAMFSPHTTRSYRKGRDPRTSPEFGTLFLCRPHLGSELLAHECGHVALAWARRMRIRDLQPDDVRWSSRHNVQLRSSPEERFCYTLGRVMRGLVDACYRHGLYREDGTTIVRWAAPPTKTHARLDPATRVLAAAGAIGHKQSRAAS